MSEENKKPDLNIPLFKVVDKTDSYIVPKTKIFSLPFRVGLVGRSGSGKTSMLVQLIASPHFYGNDFDGDRIYIVSGSLKNDEKIQRLVKYKEIPEENLFDKYNEEELKVVYEFLKDEFEEARENKEKPKHALIVLDDISFSGNLRKSMGIISELVCNCRKILISLCITTQFYTHLHPVVRSNLNGAIIYHQSNKQLELISDDWNYSDTKKEFVKAFRESTDKEFGFFVIDMTSKRSQWYNDSFSRYLDI